jgi:hypothetical protein
VLPPLLLNYFKT